MSSHLLRPPAYPAAIAAAARIHAHFEAHAPTAPDVAAIEAMIEAGFWASLRREEGYIPRISLAFVPPEAVKWPLRLERMLPLEAQPLARLGPAVERPGIHLGVWRNNGRLAVWGATRHLPAYCMVLETIAPGLLVVKHSREESEKFVNVAVFQGEEFKMIDAQFVHQPDCPDLLNSLLGFDTEDAGGKPMSVLIQLAISMRAHGRGGSLLMVPGGSEAWQESIARPVNYSVAPPFSALAELLRPDVAEDQDSHGADALGGAVEAVANLTAVDGATIIDDRYGVLAFGAKIMRRRDAQPVAEVVLTEPIEGARPEVVEPGQLGGTRHLSAAQFVYDQHDALALVASQDGRFTVFSWSECAGMVRAHRIESLLL